MPYFVVEVKSPILGYHEWFPVAGTATGDLVRVANYMTWYQLYYCPHNVRIKMITSRCL